MGAKLGGGGGSKYNVEQNSDINVTPFVDVMLVLLIIFMVTIPKATVAIKLDLPPAKSPPTQEKHKDPVFVSVMGPEDIYVGPKKVTLEQLPGEVAAALDSPDPRNERVLVRGYKDIEYGDFVKVLNTLQQNGYLKVGLINEDIE
ncbi:biopolymer transporter ExbD [Asticcacaulis solisilvae]|uniref:biopolymer transporter ExbD n=1 Tax=Asticcacaulis solisilvae TaxID=1217274 RepID=UPI003FD79775